MKVNLNISGFDTEAIFREKDIRLIHKPLIKKFTQLYQEYQQRVVIFLCAPPGCGKSTLAAFWEQLSKSDPTMASLQVLPLDGFHYTNEILNSTYIQKGNEKVALKSIKGAFQTFNLSLLIDKLKQLKSTDPTWPYYDRNLHDPIDDAIQVNKNIVIVEGNWLLLDEPVWNGLHQLADFTIFINTHAEYVKQGLIDRKIKGGLSEQDATHFYHHSDSINVDTVLNHSIKADLTIFMKEDYSLEIQ